MSRGPDRPLVLVIALAIAFLLTLLPLPAVVEPLRPYWVALVLIYWAMEVATPVRLGTAFGVGLLLDLLTASLMGLHALGLVVLVYLVRRFRYRLRFFPPWQQALAVLALLVNDRIILLWTLLLLGEPLPTWRYWLAPLVGMALWPWVFLALDQARLAQRQADRR